MYTRTCHKILVISCTILAFLGSMDGVHATKNKHPLDENEETSSTKRRTSKTASHNPEDVDTLSDSETSSSSDSNMGATYEKDDDSESLSGLTDALSSVESSDDDSRSSHSPSDEDEKENELSSLENAEEVSSLTDEETP